MKTSFGPWTSGIHTGPPEKLLLSSHWKHRLNLLGPTSRLAAAVSGKTWCAVLVAGMLLGFVPVMQPVPAQTPEGNAGTETAEPGKQKVRPGFIYSRGFIYKEGRLAGMWIVEINPRNGKWRRVIADGNDSYAIRISPDRQTMAYTYKGAIWTRGTGKGDSPGKFVQINGIPCWSPDGKSMIVSHSKRKAGEKNKWIRETYRVNEDGTVKTLLDLPEKFHVNDWSPDGKWLLRGSMSGLRMITPDGKKKKHLSKAKGYHPRFSPDGKSIAFEQQWKGSVLVTDVDGKRVRTIFGPTPFVVSLTALWSPDGKNVATLLLDQSIDSNGRGYLTADPEKTHPRIAIIDVKTGKHTILKLKVMDGVTFYPTDPHDWR